MALSDNLRGAALMTMAMLGFTLNDACMKAATVDLPVFQAIVMRGALTTLALGAMGLGTGALALLGASGLLAQIGIAVGAAAGASLLVQMLAGQRAPPGAALSLLATVVAALAALLAVFTGSLPWFCLLPTLAAPWATRLVPAGERPVWLTAFLTALAALGPMFLAVGLAWFTAGAST